MSTIKDCEKYILNTYNRFQLELEKGDGVWVYDTNGKKYLDMASGIAVSCLGHNHNEIIKTVKKQVKKLIHTSNLFYTKPCVELAKKLVKSSVFNKVFFCNSGAEANEAAIKLTRKYYKNKNLNNKYTIITMKNSFHGRTIATLSATGQEKYQKGFEPLLDGFKYVELNNEQELEKSFSNNIAGVLIEPVQAEGGIIPAKKEFIETCRKLCDKFDSILIFDEVQTGIGRTGKLFGYQHFEPIEPDVITLAKGLGGGFPIGAMLVKNKFASALKAGEHASTFGGNLVCSSVALTVLKTIEKQNILENVVRTSNFFIDKLKSLKEKYSVIKDIRGIGLLIGVEFNLPAREIINKLIEENVISIQAGDNVVRFVPPLIITEKEISFCIEKLDKILNNL